jgi:hypothetical protein
MNGTQEKQTAEVEMVTSKGLFIMVEGRRYFASFMDFPFLAKLSLLEAFSMEYCGHGHIRWETADIDLNTEILANPNAYPISFQGDSRGNVSTFSQDAGHYANASGARL